MYDLPELREALRGLWSLLHPALEQSTASFRRELLHPEEQWEAHWHDPQLGLTSVCGVDVLKRHKGRFLVVGTPVGSAPGCEGPLQHSWLVAPKRAAHRSVQALKGSRLAVNSVCSHSGCHSLIPLVAPHAHSGRFFEVLVPTGSHERSLVALQRDEADCASVDCLSYAILKKHRPALTDGLELLEKTPSAPGPPIVIHEALSDRLDRAQEAVQTVFESSAAKPFLETLMLRGFQKTTLEDYRVIERDFLSEAERQGYAELACYPAPS